MTKTKPVIVVLCKDNADSDDILPDAFGCYIGPNEPIEVEEGVSWRDALAEESARVNALEDALASLGYEVSYHYDVEGLPDEVETLTVNDEPWDLGGRGNC